MTVGYVVTYDSSSSATAIPEVIIRRVRRPLVTEVRDVYVAVPGRDSAWLFPEEPGDGTIELDIVVAAGSNINRRAAVRKLAAFFTKRSGRKPLIISDEPDRFYWAKLTAPPNVDEFVLLGKTVVKLRCGPYAESITTTSVTVAGSGTQTFTVTADDNVRMAPVVEVTTTSTAATGWEYSLNGVTVGVTDSLASSAVRSVSTISATIVTGADADAELASGVFPVSALSMQNAYGDFGYLMAGTNTIRFIRGAVSLRVVWRRRFA